MHTFPVKSKLTERTLGDSDQIVMMSVRMKKYERRRRKEICSQQDFSA
jgi:hypothetical protein